MRYDLSQSMKPLLVSIMLVSLAVPATAHESAPDVIWRKFDEYSHISFEKQKQRLANFIVQLQAERGAIGYVVSFGGRVTCPNEAQTRANRVRNYLISAGQLDSNRVKTIDAGYNEDWVIELWIAPGLAPPLTKEIARGSGFFYPSADQVKMLAKCPRAIRRKSKHRRA